MNPATNNILREFLALIELPEGAYEKTEVRYGDLGAYLCRPEAKTYKYSPLIRPQGSFRFGTVIRPINQDEEYDLDLGCRFQLGLSKLKDTQYEVKQLLGQEVEAYRNYRNIKSPLEEKGRCWRLAYQDDLAFHMDVVPSIPEEAHLRLIIAQRMIAELRVPGNVATNVSQHAGSITDNRDPNYRIITPDWRISNAEGYALWFEYRMKLASATIQARASQFKVASIEALKPYKWKTPLQQSVQLLKRHRDQMFLEDAELKPISIILTTLAGHAYNGEEDLNAAITGILTRMRSLVRASKPRVPNPVNPDEDFADKWEKDPRLEANFRRWVDAAIRDFGNLGRVITRNQLKDISIDAFGIELSDATAEKLLPHAPAASTPKVYEIPHVPAKPWAQ